MNQYYQNYNESVLISLRYAEGLNPNDTSQDHEFQKLTPRQAFDKILTYEGIVGYTGWILLIIKEVYKVQLDEGPEISFEDFVQGLGNIFDAQYSMNGVKAMRVSEKDQVTVYFDGGDTHEAKCAMDSKVGIMYDIIKQAL